MMAREMTGRDEGGGKERWSTDITSRTPWEKEGKKKETIFLHSRGKRGEEAREDMKGRKEGRGRLRYGIRERKSTGIRPTVGKTKKGGGKEFCHLASLSDASKRGMKKKPGWGKSGKGGGESGSVVAPPSERRGKKSSAFLKPHQKGRRKGTTRGKGGKRKKNGFDFIHPNWGGGGGKKRALTEWMGLAGGGESSKQARQRKREGRGKKGGETRRIPA